MYANDFLGMEVIDSEGQHIGKIDNALFDEVNGQAEYIIVKLKKGIFKRESEKIEYMDISNINDVVLLNINIDI